ncbi:hypothetical protein L1887_15394 [Cichorium endivia]|nr:hypothetical protein L1887_15394 [Cichorium endivia]
MNSNVSIQLTPPLPPSPSPSAASFSRPSYFHLFYFYFIVKCNFSFIVNCRTLTTRSSISMDACPCNQFFISIRFRDPAVLCKGSFIFISSTDFSITSVFAFELAMPRRLL